MIDSISDRGNRIYAVMVPRRACPDCRRDGEAIYGSTDKGKYRFIFFQDKDKDIFEVK